MNPSKKQRIITTEGTTSAYVVTGLNHILQKRQFAWDCRYWYYMPDSRSKYQKVNPMDVPDNVVNLMSDHSGYSVEALRAVDS